MDSGSYFARYFAITLFCYYTILLLHYLAITLFGYFTARQYSCQGFSQFQTCSMQPASDGANREIKNFGDCFVIAAVDFSQH